MYKSVLKKHNDLKRLGMLNQNFMQNIKQF